MPWTLSRCCFFLCSHYYLIFSIGGSHSGAMEEPARRLFHTPPSTVTSALGSPLITTPTLPGPLSCIADDPRESSCVLQRREKKKIHILIYMFSQLIIYFPPAVSLGQIFHSILSRIPSGISHMLLQIMLSLFWCQTAEWWETLIKVQAGFTSFLNPFRTFLNISFAALSQDLGACHKSWPKNKNLKKREREHATIVTNYCHIPDTVTGWFGNLTKPHTLRQQSQRGICFVLCDLASCPHTVA